MAQAADTLLLLLHVTVGELYFRNVAIRKPTERSSKQASKQAEIGFPCFCDFMRRRCTSCLTDVFSYAAGMGLALVAYVHLTIVKGRIGQSNNVLASDERKGEDVGLALA